MDIHQLKLFLAVMESSSMTHAAQQFHLSPGAVSLQLHSLAEELHAELFVRSGKRLVATPAAAAAGGTRQGCSAHHEPDPAGIRR